MNYKARGGSLASNHVMKLAGERCSNLRGGKHHHSKKHTKLHKVHKKSSKKTKRKSKTDKKSNSRKKVKSRKMKGGSDWVTMLYSRGPVNNSSTYNKELLRKFSKTGAFYDSQGKLNKRGNIGGGKRKKSKTKKC